MGRVQADLAAEFGISRHEFWHELTVGETQRLYRQYQRRRHEQLMIREHEIKALAAGIGLSMGGKPEDIRAWHEQPIFPRPGDKPGTDYLLDPNAAPDPSITHRIRRRPDPAPRPDPP